MTKHLFSYTLIAFLLVACGGTKKSTVKYATLPTVPTDSPISERPKLVVGIIVDQMRYDYLVRFYNKYGEGGFKRLMNNGYHFKNAHFNYIPTYTAVGHASVYSGTTPVNHGIISNWWYDKDEKKSIYCVDDSNYKTVGGLKGGDKSPYRLQTTTIADQLRMAQNMKGKSIGVSIKDRSAILPVGHTATAAYWFRGKDEGKFVSSTYYLNNLPSWATNFNSSGKISKYISKPWNTYYNINTYTESIEDNNPYEQVFKGQKTPTFPHDIPKLKEKNKGFDILSKTPFGNTAVKDFAKAAIIGENLGKSQHTDFLAVSFSSTDYVGHQFGVDSKEIEDTYIRLDKDLEEFLNFLDMQVGQDNYTLFLTADHAAVPVPSYLESLKIPAGYIIADELKDYINNVTQTYFGANDLVENVSNFQVFLDHEKIKSKNLDAQKVADVIANESINFKGIYKSITAKALQHTQFNNGIMSLLQQGYNQKFSGDVLLVPNPSTIIYPKQGSTHGSGYSYDTHVPMIFFGKRIKNGTSNDYHPITDIAPTLARLLEVEQPNGTTGNVIGEVIK